MISPVRLVYISSRTEQNLKPNTLNKNTIHTSLCVYMLSLSILHCRWFTLMTNLAPVDSFEVISNKKIFDYRFVSWPKAEIKHRENVLITTRWYIYITWKLGYSDMSHLPEIYCSGRPSSVKYVVWATRNFLEYTAGLLNAKNHCKWPCQYTQEVPFIEL